MQERLGIAMGHEWDGYDAADPIAQWIQQTQRQRMMSQPLRSAASVTPQPLRIPETLGMRFPERASTQGAFGHILVALNDIKEVAARLVTTSPDVAVSTNLQIGSTSVASTRRQSVPITG